MADKQNTYDSLSELDALFASFFENYERLAAEMDDEDALYVLEVIRSDYSDRFLPLLNQARRLAEETPDTSFEDLYWHYSRT